MKLEELKKQYYNYSSRINELISKQKLFQLEHQDLFLSLFEEKQKQDKEWLISHIDYIRKHKDTFKTREPFRNIVIDCFTLYQAGGLAGGVAFESKSDKILLSSLLTLWEKGMMFRGYPIIGIQRYIHNGMKVAITYIKDNRETTETYHTKYGNPPNKHLLESIEEWIQWIKTYNISEKAMSKWDNYKTIDILKKED
jgi:hypothetical protein